MMQTGCLILLGIAAIFDLRKKKIPLLLIVLAAAVSVAESALRLTNGASSLVQIAESLLPGLTLLALSLISAHAIGIGDGLMVLAAGPVFGARYMFAGVMLAFFLSAFVSITLLVWKKADRKTRIPFVPFLASAMGVVILALV